MKIYAIRGFDCSIQRLMRLVELGVEELIIRIIQIS